MKLINSLQHCGDKIIDILFAPCIVLKEFYEGYDRRYASFRNFLHFQFLI